MASRFPARLHQQLPPLFRLKHICTYFPSTGARLNPVKMRFSVSFSSLVLFAAAALGAPTEPAAVAVRDVDIPESVRNATVLGVDVYGPIPDDAVQMGDYWLAKAGSRASAWVRAQIDLDTYEAAQAAQGAPVEKRQWANIGIGMWTQDDCTLLQATLRTLASRLTREIGGPRQRRQRLV